VKTVATSGSGPPDKMFLSHDASVRIGVATPSHMPAGDSSAPTHYLHIPATYSRL